MNDIKPLAVAIITQAVRDWNRYIQGKPILKNNNLRNSMIEIKHFFESDWGQFLCNECGLSAETVQEKLDEI